MKIKDIVIAFDGYSSCGKSTLAKQIAHFFEYVYIDSGAMYRAVTLFAMQNNLIRDAVINIDELKNNINNIEIKFIYNEKLKKQETFLNGQNIENEIRSIAVSDKVSYISELGFVRTKLVDLQQKLGKQKRIVMDGRDIGTVVFPDAELKIFMTASSYIRAKRRYKELVIEEYITFSEVKKNIEKRDYIDENRDISPLRKAEDAIVIDNSNLTREEQFDKVKNLIIDKFSI